MDIHANLVLSTYNPRQNLLGSPRGEYEIHIRGLLSLLGKMPDQEPQSDFHRQGISAAWSVVVRPGSRRPGSRKPHTNSRQIGECIMDPSIKIPQRLVDRRKCRFGPIASDPAGYTTEFYTLRWENLIPLPAQLDDPDLYQKEIASTYHDMLLEAPRLIAIATHLSRAANKTRDKTLALRYILAETGNSELVSMALVLNTTMQMLHPANTADLARQAASLVDEVIRATERLDRFRPLGTARLPPALCLAWVVAPSAEQKAKMDEVLNAHVYDFRGVTWQDLAARYVTRFQRARQRVHMGRLAGSRLGVNCLSCRA